MVVSILLTATVTPHVEGPVALADPAVRLAQYRSAVAQWSEAATALGFSLHIVETSGTPADAMLRDVRPAHRGGIGYGVVTPGESVSARGKGASEFHVIEQYATHNGLLINDDDCLYKATGRLILANPGLCVGTLSGREVRVRMTLDRSFADTRLVGAGSIGWRYIFSDIQNSINDRAGVYAEHAVAASIAGRAPRREVVLTRFPRRPRFIGQSGSNGTKYGQTFAPAAASAALEKLLVDFGRSKQV